MKFSHDGWTDPRSEHRLCSTGAELPALASIGSLLGGIGGIVGAGMALSNKPPKPAPIPEPKEPKVMPAADDEASRDADRRRVAAIQTRGGRASTILSDVGGSDTLG